LSDQNRGNKEKEFLHFTLMSKSVICKFKNI